MPETPPVLSIVFVNRNTSDLLAGALDSLKANLPDFPVEVIVVDNGSSGERRAASGERRALGNRRSSFVVPFTLIANRQNLGYGAAANQGIALARGEFIAVANPDIRFLPQTLDRLVEFLRADSGRGIVAPQFLWPDLTPQPSARRFPRLGYVLSGRRSPLRRPASGARRPSRIVQRRTMNESTKNEFLYPGIEDSAEAAPVEVVIGAFLVAPRSLLLELGGFDESYFMFVEDVDLCRRAQELGRGVYVLPQARMIHLGGASRQAEDSWVEFIRLRSFYSYFRREYRPASGVRRPASVGVRPSPVPRPPSSFRFMLLPLFSIYLAVLLAGRLLGLREWEHRVNANCKL
jgi:GT2 family glycosyltransferase